MSIQGKYSKSDIDCMYRNGIGVERGHNGLNVEDKIYTYDEALDLVGQGWYTYGLVAFLTLAFQGISLDLFGLAVVLTGACDMNLTHYQMSVLLSMPLIGSICMAWPWGYAADTQGRQRSLTVSLWGSLILSTISVFSPNWIVLAILKFASATLSSGTQSLGFTLLGETCSQKYKAPFMVIVTSSIIATYGVFTVLGYFVLNLDVSIDLHFITFTNWRLLMLVFALPLGLSAILVGFIFESPKFLLNAGHEKRAIEILKEIMRRNGKDDSNFTVKKIVLNESTTLKLKDVPLWQSVRDQTLPLFKPPLLYRTVQMFYITAAVYSLNNGWYAWLPFVADTFYEGYYSGNGTTVGGVCDMIVNSKNLNTGSETCVGTVKDLVLWMAVIQTIVFLFLNVGIYYLSRWKKFVMVGMMLFAVACGMLIPSVTDKMVGLILLNGFLINSLCIALIFSYYVDLFPTSYRGMASCLGVMAARISGLFGCNLVGSYVDSHCITSFYAWSIYLLSGAVVTWFLPSDNVKSAYN